MGFRVEGLGLRVVGTLMPRQVGLVGLKMQAGLKGKLVTVGYLGSGCTWTANINGTCAFCWVAGEVMRGLWARAQPA